LKIFVEGCGGMGLNAWQGFRLGFYLALSFIIPMVSLDDAAELLYGIKNKWNIWDYIHED
jgi:hypothetical protein